MSIAQLETLYSAAIAALEAGDYATAILKATAAKFRIATTPNLARNLAGGGSQQISWNDASAIDRFIADCRRAASAATAASSGAFAQSKVTYARSTTTDDYE